jgi:CubicO group peptidase (beta-lactamase class C family)
MAGFQENASLRVPGIAPDLQTLVPFNPQMLTAALGQLDAIIGHAMAETGVPGLAAAVVHDGEVLYARGFGIRDKTTSAPVDPLGNTVFQLASVSKPLSATVVARAVDLGAVKWTDPVTGHLPSFALADPYVTAQVTLGDLFSHRSGLPDHAGDLLEDLGYGQEQVLEQLRLEPLAPFRATWHYTNFGLTAAAVAAAAAAGRPWPDLARDLLFDPVRMLSSSFRYSDFLGFDDRAAMHVREGAQWVQKYTRDADPQAPAGGASSNVRDLAKWLTLQLAGGTWNGQPLIGADALTQAWLPWARSGTPSVPRARSGFYGLGTNVSYDYTGRLRLSHSGGFAQGAATAITMVPLDGLGMVVLTNGMPIGVPEAIIGYFLDHVYAGTQQQNWLALFGERFAQMYVNHSQLAGKTPPASPVPPQPDSFYQGTYENPYYGPVEVTAGDGTLHLLIGPKPSDFPLKHWSGDLFAFFPTGENAVGITAATFTPGASGTLAQGVTLEYYDATGLGTFTRA